MVGEREKPAPRYKQYVINAKSMEHMLAVTVIFVRAAGVPLRESASADREYPFYTVRELYQIDEKN